MASAAGDGASIAADGAAGNHAASFMRGLNHIDLTLFSCDTIFVL